MFRPTLTGLALVIAATAAPAFAAPIVVASYAMPNGSGQASGGTYNYWDRSYSGLGATTTDGAALSGGTGDLTDGVIASSLWYNTENVAGTGPYVGWRQGFVSDPLITFNFNPGAIINSIAIHMDNSQVGGVFQPPSIFVDGAAVAFNTLTPGTAGLVNITGLNLTGTSHTIQFLGQGNGAWTFISEVSFAGTSAVPEPASWALMIGGFGLVGVALRRRRTVRAAIA